MSGIRHIGFRCALLSVSSADPRWARLPILLASRAGPLYFSQAAVCPRGVRRVPTVMMELACASGVALVPTDALRRVCLENDLSAAGTGCSKRGSRVDVTS